MVGSTPIHSGDKPCLSETELENVQKNNADHSWQSKPDYVLIPKPPLIPHFQTSDYPKINDKITSFLSENVNNPHLTAPTKFDTNQIDPNLPPTHKLKTATFFASKNTTKCCNHINISECGVLGSSDIFLWEKYKEQFRSTPGTIMGFYHGIMLTSSLELLLYVFEWKWWSGINKWNLC